MTISARGPRQRPWNGRGACACRATEHPDLSTGWPCKSAFLPARFMTQSQQLALSRSHDACLAPKSTTYCVSEPSYTRCVDAVMRAGLPSRRLAQVARRDSASAPQVRTKRDLGLRLGPATGRRGGLL